jgi:hypothetical protein
MVVSLSSHDDFERFQDLAYDAFRVIETRQVSPFLSIFKTESTDYVLSQSWIRQIEGIVGPVKANAKAKELVSRLKGIVSTTNYYLSIYQEEHNIHTLLEGCRFPKNAIQFKVIFSSVDEAIRIDLPEEHAQALQEAYRFLVALYKGDCDSFVSFLDEYGETSYDKDRLRECFHHLEEFPRCIDISQPRTMDIYERLHSKEAL